MLTPPQLRSAVDEGLKVDGIVAVERTSSTACGDDVVDADVPVGHGGTVGPVGEIRHRTGGHRIGKDAGLSCGLSPLVHQFAR